MNSIKILLEDFFNTRVNSVQLKNMLPFAVQEYEMTPANKRTDKDSYLFSLENAFFNFEIDTVDTSNNSGNIILLMNFSNRFLDKSIIIFGEMMINLVGISVLNFKIKRDDEFVTSLNENDLDKLQSQLRYMNNKEYYNWQPK